MTHKYEGPDRRQSDEGWHLDKRIPIATLVTLLVLAAGGIMHIAEIRKDVELLREQNKAIVDRMNRADLSTGNAIGDLKQAVQRMDQKLDRLIERGNGK